MKPMLFTRYVWCDNCNTWEAHDTSGKHQKALNSECPYCNSSAEIVSRAPESHEKRLAKLAALSA